MNNEEFPQPSIPHDETEKNPDDDINESYQFSEQLDYNSLMDILEKDTRKVWTETEVTEILKNDIIKKAYQQGKEITLVISDQNNFTVSHLTTENGDEIELDYSEYIKTPTGYFEYPNTILAYARISDDTLEEVTKNGVFSMSRLAGDFIDEYIETLRQKGAIELNKIYESNEAKQLLIDKGIRKVLKQHL